VPGVVGHGALELPARLDEPALLSEREAQAPPRVGVSRLFREHALELLRRLRGPAGLEERQAQVGPVPDPVGAQRDHPLEVNDGLAQLAAIA
jgi:hypothetical protein